MSGRPDESIEETLREALRGRSDVHVALLFGSQAIGRARPDSDVDLAVIAPGADLFALAAQLEKAVGKTVDVVSLDTAFVPVVAQVIEHGILVHEGVRGAAATWRARALCDLEIDLPWYRRMRDAWLARVAERGLGHGQR